MTALLFDISDLLEYLRASRLPTGIQRVQLNILRQVLAAEPDAAACAYAPEAAEWRPVPAPLFLRLAALSASGADANAPEWQAALAGLANALANAPPCAMGPGTMLVNLGSSWWQPGYMRRVAALKRDHGIRYIPFLYDCIPLLLPEHCAAGLVDEFSRWFAQLCLLADAVAVISDCTGRDFARLSAPLLGGASLPSFVVPLNVAAELSPATPAPAELAGCVLFVATLESRKNHLLVFRAWQQLLQRHGPAMVPRLVCVGKRGWLAEPALAFLAANPTLAAHVRLLHNVADGELAGLYQACRFTLFNSFYEGWGLPVTESLSHGKVALVADNSALPEAGAGGALHFPSNNLADLVEKLETLLLQPEALPRLQARLLHEVRLRDWAALAAQLVAELRALLAASPSAPRLALRPGEVWETRALPGPTPSLAMAGAELTRMGPTWLPLEAWGCWVLPGRSVLRLPLAEMPGQAPLRVLVVFVGPPAPWHIGLRAGPAEGPLPAFTWLQGIAGQIIPCALEIPASAWPEVVVEFEAPEAVPLALVTPEDQRQVGFGLLHLMVCRADDFAARLDYLERQTLPGLARI